MILSNKLYELHGGFLTMARFTLPRDLYHGNGVMSEVLAGLNGKKAIIVTG